MFLSNLRVTAGLFQDMECDPAAQDALLHVFDLMSTFPPALRTLHLLGQGQTPSPSECAALSHSCFHILETFMPEDLIGNTRQRLFEGSRLLFGFLLEKARSVKLHESQLASPQKYPYLGALQVVEALDCITNEPLMEPVLTEFGVVEKALFDAFATAGILALSTMQPNLSRGNVDASLYRRAMLGGGTRPNVSAFCRDSLVSNYTYADNGSMAHFMDESELHELHYLAELCGRNKLAVHRPSQLTSAVAPCLTFDRNAHVAVYLGEQGCSEPGRSSLVFKPLTGITETPHAAVVEQLIEPIIKTYEAEGTSLFDAFGGAATRKLEAPDEILMFCVDCSASMRQATDFAEVNDDGEEELASDSTPHVEGEYFAEARYEDVKEELCKQESFNDMVAIVAATAAGQRRKNAAAAVLSLLVSITASQLVKRVEELERTGQMFQFRYGTGAVLRPGDEEVKRQKSFYAGLRTHEQQIKDFLIYRATVFTPSSNRWTWSPGDDVPDASVSHSNIPMLPDELTHIPDEIRCPISQDVMVDAVKASDGHIYSRHALRQWFAVRKSSPLHGTTLHDTSTVDQTEIMLHALQWIEGEGLIELPQDIGDGRPEERYHSTSASELITLNFNSHLGGFARTVPKDLSLEDLYKLAFRGLKARHNMFQLVHSDSNRVINPSPTGTVSTQSLHIGGEITIRIAEDANVDDTSPHRGVAAGDLALIKVYGANNNLIVSYWVNRYTSLSIASVQWKFWRALSEQ
jgi:hypothetical protein